MKTLRIAVLALTGAILCAACVPEPPPPATPVAAVIPPTTTTLPPAPVGAATGPVDPADSPDPFILQVDPSYCTPPDTSPSDAPTTCYLAYTTQWYLVMLPLWRSTDLVTWSRVSELPNNGSAMTELAPWTEWGHHWAPAVIERPLNPPEARFVMWYTAKDKTTRKQCLGVATAETAIGPFTDSATQPAYCPPSDEGTIDPSPFVDTNGNLYLTYAGIPNRLWISELTSDGRSLVAGTETLLLTGGAPDDSVVEAPNLVRAGDALYLFYSTDEWWTADYRVAVARCDSVTGPCTRMYSTAVLATRGTMAGPGGQTPFLDAFGSWNLIFHAWTSPQINYPSGARSMRILPLSFAGGQVTVG